MQFTLTPFVVEPTICTFTYACAMTGSPVAYTGADLCAIDDGDTQSVFNVNTGNFEFYSIDMAKYPAGDYTFEITGTVGTKSTTANFVMKLVDPCHTTLLTIISPDPFTD